MSLSLMNSQLINYLSSLYNPVTNCTQNVSSLIACSPVAEETTCPNELFPSNGYCGIACLHSCFFSVGLRVTVWTYINKRCKNFTLSSCFVMIFAWSAWPIA
jgi:hypothetical protein